MSSQKEYNDRWIKPLVNPPTTGETTNENDMDVPDSERDPDGLRINESDRRGLRDGVSGRQAGEEVLPKKPGGDRRR